LQFGLRLIHDQEVLNCGNLHSYERSVRTVCKDKRAAPASGHPCNQLACVNVELERANEYKKDLLAEVAHEFAQPDPANQSITTGERIDRQAQHAARLTDEWLN
jgi:hypothetical protein